MRCVEQYRVVPTEKNPHNLEPAATTDEEQVNRAIAYYQNLAEKGYFNRIIASNVSQNVVVDSIRCDFDCYPYAIETFARQKIVRESNVTERTLVTTCRLRNAERSDNNPQGFLIEDLRILENKDLGSYER